MSPKLMSALRNASRRLRWIAGRGWRAEDFAPRYATPASDVWGYRVSPDHLTRAGWILEAMPEGRFRRVLEVGCAQGFLTERLAPRADSLIACDFSPEAIAAAKAALAGAAQVECRVADIRDGFPGADFDLVLFSDVLYYLSKRETDRVLADAGRNIAPGGHLLIANEWRADARGLTAPDYAFSRLDADRTWTRVTQTRRPFSAGEFMLGLYRRH
jgi:SAM-dependent methyltransferase